MKICYDNLEGMVLTKRGNLRKKFVTYIEKESCKFCGDAYLMIKAKPTLFCGQVCANTHNLVGMRFGRLQVTEFAYTNKHKQKCWKCLCDCGNKHIVNVGNLVSGFTKSCGCLRIDIVKSRSGEKHQWYKHGKAKTASYQCEAVQRRNARKLNQTPESANLKKIQLYYTISAYLNKGLEIPAWHVDHIRPISKGGLHHEDNLQILTATINLQKNDKYTLTKEEEVKYKGVRI